MDEGRQESTETQIVGCVDRRAPKVLNGAKEVRETARKRKVMKAGEV